MEEKKLQKISWHCLFKFQIDEEIIPAILQYLDCSSPQRWIPCPGVQAEVLPMTTKRPNNYKKEAKGRRYRCFWYYLEKR